MRPYFRKSITELEELFAQQKADVFILTTLQDELSHRETLRAASLRAKVRTHLALLKANAAVSTNRVADDREPSGKRSTTDQLATLEKSNIEQARPMAADAVPNPEEQPNELGELNQPQSDDTTKLLTAFKYLKKVAEYSRKVVYAIEDHGQLRIFEHDLVGLPGISFNSTIDGEIVWIKIERLRKETAPEPSSNIAVWLSLKKESVIEPEIVTSRMVTVSDDQAQHLVDESLVRQENVRVNLDDARLRDVTFLLEDAPDAKIAIQQYIDTIWQPWAVREIKRRRTISHYEKLFTLHKVIESEGTEFPWEVVCGIGLARQKVGAHRINTPVIEQLVEIEMASDSSLLVRPRQREPFVGLAPFGGSSVASLERVIDIASKHFSNMAAHGERDLNPFDSQSFSPVLSAAASYLDQSGRYLGNERPADRPRDPTLPTIEDSLIVTDTWVVFARARSDDSYIQDLDRLMRQIADSESSQGIPNVGRRLIRIADGTVQSESDLDIRGKLVGFGPGGGQSSSGDGDQHNRQTGGSTGGASIAGTEERETAAPVAAGTEGYFLPLSFNDEQIEILRRLEQKDEVGVVVQGPPGTGKSHTIANIVCHYLATGRRVLVTSKGEPALAVLREKIPASVRQLTISLLTNEREGLKQLERAIGMLSEEVTQTDIPTVERDIRSTGSQLGGLKSRLRQIDERLLQLGKTQLEAPPSYLVAHLPRSDLGSLAKWCAARQDAFQWLADRPSTRPDEWGLSDADLEELKIARLTLGDDISYVGHPLPNASEFPDAAQVVAIHSDLIAATQIEQRTAAGEVALLSLRVERASERAKALRNSIAELLVVRELTDGWTRSLLERAIKLEQFIDSSSLLGRLLSDISRLAEERKRFLGRPIEGLGPEQLHAEVLEALSRVARGERPFGILPFGYKRARVVMEQIRVSGIQPDSQSDWEHTHAWAQWLIGIQQFVIQWNVLVEEEGTVRLQFESNATGRWLTSTAALLVRIERTVAQHARLIRDEVNVLFPRGLNADSILTDSETAQAAIRHIDENLARTRLSRASDELRTWIDAANKLPGPIGKGMSLFLRECVGNTRLPQLQISKTWDELLAELKRLKALSSSMATVRDVSTKVRQAGFIDWATKLLQQPATAKDSLAPSDWREACLWAVAEAHLNRLDCRIEMRELLEESRRKSNDAVKAMERLVALATTRALAKKIRGSDLVGAALQKFAAAMRQIGTGKGIRAPRFRRMAQEAMRNCYGSVPCWIMPAWRVSEMLPSQLESFSLVVVDEASQSDASALATLVRGKKVLVVGDDRQVSPAAVGTEEGFIRQLRHSYLRDLPHGDLMLPGSSLYDLAGAMFPGQKIMLREHFRCVEPIIRYSNQFYNREILPVRIPKASERIDPPLVDVYVRDGLKEGKINRREAQAIFEEIIRLTRDASFSRRTIGVISLIGHEQAHYINKLLYSSLDQDAYIRHQIECGDSATFQGKEKDIMFLSMIASPGQAKTVTGMMYEQRFNVAVSRARDRCYLFRSVRRDELSSTDLKAKLIEHFQNPVQRPAMSSADLVERCEGEFEPEVFRRLSKLGYTVTPQVKSGPFRIDMVVEGANDSRLAIELDGDCYHPPEQWAEDFRRQQILERVGWRFWRCFASTYARNPDSVMGELVQELTRLGIEPNLEISRMTRYTEHREWPEETAIDETDLNAVAEMAAETTSSPVVEVGDSIVLLYEGDGGRQYTITISSDRHDPDNGIWSWQHKSGRSLLGAEEEDVVEIETPQGIRRATILRVDKANPEPDSAGASQVMQI
ncbi:MAG: AAA family ATPase [Aestuariivirga sp.]